MGLPEEKKELLESLKQGDLQIDGQFMWGSNYTFLCQLTHAGSQFKVVYKPVRGERPLWDFPSESLAGREVAAYLVSEYGGWGFVPPTVYRQDAPAGAGSVQLYIEHDPERHYFNLTVKERRRLKPVVLFDAVINNTDRKGGHLLLGADGKTWLIDHGVCFHAQPKLRTVIWDFAGKPIPKSEVQRLEGLREQLQNGQPLRAELNEYLSAQELRAMQQRIESLLAEGVFPSPSGEGYSYPWPPV
jgi:hypothetical protein